MRLTPEDVGTLACPLCRGGLRFDGDLTRAQSIDNGFLDCMRCGRAWPVQGGLAALLEESEVRGLDAWLRPIYDFIAPAHDLGVLIALPLMQIPDPGASRDRYMECLDLKSLRARPGGPPLRVLEVGIGSGGNLPLIDRDLPGELEVEIWGLDLSRRMLRECDRRLQWYTGRPVRLLLGDAHRLPFTDQSFDRVLHVGGINGYRDPAAALAEMARVARPDTPIVVVDEHLDPDRPHLPHHYLAFWGLTWIDPDPQPPVKHLPKGASNVEVTRVSRFYYCLTFRMPAIAVDGTIARMSRATQDDLQGGSTMSKGDGQLDSQELQAIRDAYDNGVMNAMLREGFEGPYPATGAWLDALNDAFDDNLADEGDVGRQRFSRQDRERCIIAILTGRGGERTLAIHIYMAIALGVEVEEIKQILFLTGLYTGADNFAAGLRTLRATVVVLENLAFQGKLTVGEVVTALLGAFPR